VITATIRPDGTGTIDLPGNPTSIHEASAADARRKAVDVLTTYARGYQRVDVAALDVDGMYQLVFTPDGVVLSTGPYGNQTSQGTIATGNPARPVNASTDQHGTIHIDMPNFIPATPPAAADDSEAGDTTPAALPIPDFATQQPAAWVAAPPEEVTAAHRAELILPSGETATVTHAAVLGRRPTAENEDQQLITVDDGRRSVSRSHALLAWNGDQLVLTDLHSANGTTISRQGQLLTVEADAATPIHSGDTVSLGDQPITINITQARD